MAVLLQVLLATLASAASGATVYDQRQSGKTNVRVELRDAVIVAIGDGELGGDYDYNYDYSDLTIKPSQQTPTTAAAGTTTTIYGTATAIAGTTTATAVAPTVLPPKPSTAKPITSSTTSSGSFNITQNAAVVLEAENNSIIFPANAKPGGASGEPIKITATGAGYKPDQIPVLVLQEAHRPNKFLPVKTVEKEGLSVTLTPANGVVINPKELPARHCAPGYSLDNQNRCRRVRRPSRERPQLPIGLRFDHRPLVRS